MLQGGEFIIILIVALVVLGPSRLPDLARKAGQYATELRRAAREVREGLEAEVSDLKAAGDELRAVNREIRKPFEEARESIDEVGVSRLDWKGPKPLSGPTPADAMADLEEIEARQKLEEQADDDNEGDEGTT
ncbi:MAG TPA: twin-arginine translocase TatA/TatE family subunit [Acidimicrobiia bacterium]|nr:twin-arginine translocase TatA/TatE family subunit [Acidimicrobiia bacterium]